MHKHLESKLKKEELKLLLTAMVTVSASSVFSMSGILPSTKRQAKQKVKVESVKSLCCLLGMVIHTKCILTFSAPNDVN